MITVIGLGFVGLTSALGFAEKGLQVYGIEKDIEKYKTISSGKIYFHEPFLEEKLNEHILNKNIIITQDLKQSILNSEVIMICVGTPSSDSGKVDLSQIMEVIKEISNIKFNSFKVLCIKSTVPPSSIENEIIPYINQTKEYLQNNLGITHNPEFLREGFAWQDFIKPDRIVIGSNDEKSKLILNKIYEKFDAQIFNVNLNTAEFIKYASNTFLASLISFSNELEMIAYSIGGIDIKKSFSILHKDSRWSGNPGLMTSYLFPGYGFGGYCLPKDLKAMIIKSQEYNYNPTLLKEINEVNTKIKHFLSERLIKSIKKEEKICILGLSFKPNSDDVRDSPSAWIINDLIQRGFVNLVAYDPLAIDNFIEVYNFNIEYLNDLNKVIDISSTIILVTAWPEFEIIKNNKNNKKIFDLRFYL